MAIRIDADGKLLCTTDYLGTYPLFVYSRPHLTVCTSVLRMFDEIAELKRPTNLEAIANSLLLAHFVFGETAYQDVIRSDPRAVMEVRRGVITSHECSAPTPVVVSRDHATDVAHELLTEVNAELVPKTRGVLMSGGLDSRLLSGYLHAPNLAPGYRAVMIGHRDLFDVRFGTAVANHLGLPPVYIPREMHRLPYWLGNEAKWDTAQSGGFMTHMWCLMESSELDGGPVFTGLLGDAIAGGSHIGWGYDKGYRDYTFETMFRTVNSWGFPERIIRKLFRGESAATARLTDSREILRQEFESYDEECWKKCWWFDLLHRQRFFVGRFAKLMAYRSWPVMPLADYRIREYCGSLPLDRLGDRALEYDIVVQKFSALARLPLDRGTYDTRSVIDGLRPSRVPWAVEEIRRVVRAVIDARTRPPDGASGQLFDMNGQLWRPVRKQFEHVIPLLSTYIDTRVAAELLTPAHIPATDGGPVATGCGRKALMTTLYWLAMQQHPARIANMFGHEATGQSTKGLTHTC
jgi:hypothetical protein